jgi:hypothetical protein
MILEAVDDANLVGAPQDLIAGDVADLRRPYAAIVDKAGYEYRQCEHSGRIGARRLVPGLDRQFRSALNVVKAHFQNVEINEGECP